MWLAPELMSVGSPEAGLHPAGRGDIVAATLLILLLCAGLGACTSAPMRPRSEAVPLTEGVAVETEALQLPATLPSAVVPTTTRALIERALGALGSPYRYGGDSPTRGFDCSGFVRWVLADWFPQLPHSARAQSEVAAETIDAEHLATGDLLFFHSRRSRRIDHVGIYLGDGQFIHAPRSHGRVRIELVTAPWWRSRLSLARRLQPSTTPRLATEQ